MYRNGLHSTLCTVRLSELILSYIRAVGPMDGTETTWSTNLLRAIFSVR